MYNMTYGTYHMDAIKKSNKSQSIWMKKINKNINHNYLNKEYKLLHLSNG